MTIQEAIKSGKPFKRKNWSLIYWMENAMGALVYWHSLMEGIQASVDCIDILADDWEIKE